MLWLRRVESYLSWVEMLVNVLLSWVPKPLSHGGSQQFILARTVSTDWRTFMYGCPALGGSWQAESFEVAHSRTRSRSARLIGND